MKKTLTFAACMSSSTCGRSDRASFFVNRLLLFSRIRCASSQMMASSDLRLGAGEAVEVAELRGCPRPDRLAEVLRERLRSRGVLRREALGGELRQEVHRDHRLARPGAAADQEHALLGAALPIANLARGCG